MRGTTLWLVGCLAGVLIGWAAGVAGATRLEFPNGERGFRASWAPVEIVTPVSTLRCDLTLEGSFHSRTLTKVEGALIGYVTRAAVSGCAATVLSETLPWHVTYGGFAGTLPLITSMRLNVLGASISGREPFGAACLFRSSSTNPIKLIGETASWEEELELEGTGFIVPTMRAEEAARIPLTGGFCAGSEASLRGAASVTVLGETRKIRLGLMGLVSRVEGGHEAGEEPNVIRAFIRNPNPAGGARIRINVISLGGTNPGNYGIEDPNTCEGRRLAPGHVCSYKVIRFVAGGEAQVNITSNPAGVPSFVVM